MPALSTLSTRLRERIPHLSCAIIKSGTSRFVVLREEELPTGRARGKIILDLLANAISTDGVGGQHYQSNKVTVMGPARGEASFIFRLPQWFLNRAGSLEDGVLKYSLLIGTGRHAPRGRSRQPKPHFEIRQPATNQAVGGPPEGDCWEGAWDVRFTNLHHLWSHMTRNAQPFRFKHKGVTVNGEIVSHGNVFVMTDLPMAKVTPDLVGALNKHGEDLRARSAIPRLCQKSLFTISKRSRAVNCNATRLGFRKASSIIRYPARERWRLARS